jgi:hypothetical protein
VPRRHTGLEREIELAQAPNGAPLAQQHAEVGSGCGWWGRA